MRKLLRSRVFLYLCLPMLCVQAHSQTVVVDGTVTASTTPVRYASVTYEDQNNPANQFSALTDSAGRYQLNVIATSVEVGTPLPTKFELDQNYPNPFWSSTAIPYQLKAQSETRVKIYDILGRVVREIDAGAQPAGVHRVLWDGRNSLGQRVGTGTYFYSLQAGGEFQARKMVLRAGSSTALTLPRASSNVIAAQDQDPPQRLLVKSFTVRIANTDTTSPIIFPAELSDVTIQGDTTINLSVAAIPKTTVYPDSARQYIRGFGGANIINWRPAMTAGQIQTAFGSGEGQLGFTILRLRVPYNSSDFNGQLAVAQLAQAQGAIVFASPWTPPPSMKTNNNIAGGMLLEGSYASYASHLKAFADHLENNGVPLYALSLQNEPDADVTYESCYWNATQFLNFTKNNAPAIGRRIIIPESLNFNHAFSDSTLNDSSAAANVSIIGGHLYGGGLAPYPLAVSKGKEVWMTEHLVLDTSWTAVLATGKEIHDCMIAGMNAYVWWYIVRYYGPMLEDGTVAKRGYVMSQFARFVRPGYHRIASTLRPQANVHISSYKDDSTSKVVIVALNLSTSAVSQTFSVTGGSMTTFTLYTTSQTKNCAQGSALPVTNGSFTTTLDASSITTFVSN